MGNSSSSSARRGYATTTGRGAEAAPAAASGGAARALLSAKKQAQAKAVSFQAEEAAASSPALLAGSLASPGALASLGFTAFLRDNAPAVRRMFDGLRQAAAVEASLQGGPPGPLPSDVTAAAFCDALTRLGYELGWQGNAPPPGASPAALRERATAKRQMLGKLLPVGGLFRVNARGERLIAWGEYLQILGMCEAAASAARGATSDAFEARHGARDLVEDLTSDLRPPPPMGSLQRPAPLPPAADAEQAQREAQQQQPAQQQQQQQQQQQHPQQQQEYQQQQQQDQPQQQPQQQQQPQPQQQPQQPSSATLAPIPLPPPMTVAPPGGKVSTSPPRVGEDEVSALLRRQIAASELALSGAAAAVAGAPPPFNPSTSLMGASFFPADGAPQATFAQQQAQLAQQPALPPSSYYDASSGGAAAAYGAEGGALATGSGPAAVRSLLQSPSRIPVYLPKAARGGGGGGAGEAAAEAAVAAAAAVSAAEQAAAAAAARPLTDEDILAAALAGGEDLEELGRVEGGGGGGGSEWAGSSSSGAAAAFEAAASRTALWGSGLRGGGGGDPAVAAAAAAAAAAASTRAAAAVMQGSAMYKPLAAVLAHYQESLDVLFNYFAFQQKKPSGVTGGAGDTFEAYAAKGYCLNKAALLRCAKFLGMVGTMGNGQAVLLSKGDLEAVWTDLIRNNKQVRSGGAPSHSRRVDTPRSSPAPPTPSLPPPPAPPSCWTCPASSRR